ncbi:hypothetical protein FRC10_001797 [Ceratobasidium sp. 414]|nr:hypothetical protein FRC10_001797 [Ceratobasidium sp. 414]
MFIPLLPLLALAIGLQGSAFNHLNCYNTADLVGWTSLLRVEGRMLEPLFPSFPTEIRMSARIENTPLSSLFNSASVTASGFGQPAVHGHSGLSHGGLKPTRQSSANVPIRGSADRLSTSAISPFSLPTTVVAARPGHARASDYTESSYNPQVTQEADHALSLPHPIPTLLPVAVPSPGERFLSCPPTNAYGELEATVPPTIIVVGATATPGCHGALGSCYGYFRSWSTSELAPGFTLPVSQFTTFQLAHSNLYDSAPPDSVLLPRSSGLERTRRSLTRLPGSTACHLPEYVQPLAPLRLVCSLCRTVSYFVACPNDSYPSRPRSILSVARRVAAQDLRVDEAMKGVNGAMKELSEHVANMPRWDEESDAPVANASTERRRDGMRGGTGVSPLAHERTSGLSAAGALPTPSASRMRAASGVSRAGGDAANDLEVAGWMPFNPTAASSPAIRRSMRPDG